MEEDQLVRGTVDPEVRAYVYSLVTALGGTGADEDGRYILGDDALACLKDIKRWLKLYDEKANRLDVARCLAEANLVKGDLLEILAAWPEDATEDRVKSKIALACLEILVPLTWPIEKNDLQTTVNHHRHIPYLQLAQIAYKREILEHHSSGILRTAVRIGLPSIALPMGERTSRDEGIIKLLLYFLRNITMVSAPQNLSVEWNEHEVSRSATIERFQQQDVLALLLTLSSNMGEDFNFQDVVVLELLFHLVKGVDVEKLFMNETAMEAKNSGDLKGLMAKESSMLREFSKNAPTRHNRFGTMIWIKRDDERVSTVSGQEVLSDRQHTLTKMDQSKKWNRPKQRSKHDEMTLNSFDLVTPLTGSATQHLRTFVEDFLDSGFNPLFSHVRRAIEREADRVLEIHSQQFFYLVSWFLDAERARRKNQKDARERKGKHLVAPSEAESFGIVASVLNQETFILLNRFMQDRLDLKSWHEVNAGMRCFTQILLTVQEMADSSLEDDQDIAENIQNRIFYEETTHDRIIAILRGFKDQGFSYLDACTELSHVFLRMLEKYSKENADLQIRSRRRARKKKEASNTNRDQSVPADNDDSGAEDVAEAQRVTKERKFDFARFSTKFLTQSCINTFVVFTSFFKDLDDEQLKRAHRFFYRAAFKQDMSVMLFRIDIIALFHKMIQGPEGLSKASPMYQEWEALARQLMRKMFKKLEQRPELAVELLFSKISSTLFYLEFGYDKQTISSRPRAPAELQVKGAMTKAEQIGVAVAVLWDVKLDAVDFVRSVLVSAASERLSWEAEDAARNLPLEGEDGNTEKPFVEIPKAPSILVKPDTDERRMAMFKDNKLRLLMSLAGFERLGIEDEPDTPWIIPSSLTSATLKETLGMIEKYRNDPVMQYGDEDPISAEDMLRRKSAAPRRRADFDDDSGDDGHDSLGEEEFLFPAGGPANRKADALAELKKRRRKRRVQSGDEQGGLDDETLELRRNAREIADLEKRRKIKSTEFVHDSDEEDDEERDRAFFVREDQLRKGLSTKVVEAMKAARLDVGAIKIKKRKRRVATVPHRKKSKNSGSDEESANEGSVLDGTRSSSPLAPAQADSSEDEGYDTPTSSLNALVPAKTGAGISPNISRSSPSQNEVSGLSLDKGGDDEEEEEEMVLLSTSRRRARMALLDDSDEE